MTPAFNHFVNALLTDLRKSLNLPLKMTYNDVIANKTLEITVEEGHRILRSLQAIKDWDLAYKLELRLIDAAYVKGAYAKTYKKFKENDPFFEEIDSEIIGIWLYGDVAVNHWSGNYHIFDYGKGYKNGRYETIIERTEYNEDDLETIEKHLFWFLTSETLWNKEVPRGTPKNAPTTKPHLQERDDAKALNLEPLLEELMGADDMDEVITQLVDIFRLVQSNTNQSSIIKAVQQSDVENKNVSGDFEHRPPAEDTRNSTLAPKKDAAMSDEQKARKSYLKKKTKFGTTLADGPKGSKDDE